MHIGFASRVRNVSLGVARRNFNAKNLEEALKTSKLDNREVKKKNILLEEQINELKKQMKKLNEKMNNQEEIAGNLGKLFIKMCWEWIKFKLNVFLGKLKGD